MWGFLKGVEFEVHFPLSITVQKIQLKEDINTFILCPQSPHQLYLQIVPTKRTQKLYLEIVPRVKDRKISLAYCGCLIMFKTCQKWLTTIPYHREMTKWGLLKGVEFEVYFPLSIIVQKLQLKEDIYTLLLCPQSPHQLYLQNVPRNCT